MKSKIIIISLLILSVVYFSSCSKEKEIMNTQTNEVTVVKQIVQGSNGILTFVD